MSNADQWATPRWERYRKHLPPNPRTKSWEQVVRETVGRGATAYYHQDLIGRIEELEIQTVQEGVFLHEHGPVRYFWREFDRVIGASCGEQTRFILVEYHRTGGVHGHPVTWQELRKKGAEH